MTTSQDIIPPTPERVPQHTNAEINDRIRRDTERHIAYYGGPGRSELDRRLEELDREWDIERTLEANAASVALIGLTLGTVLNRRWHLLPAIVAGFLLQHAVQGWCPPVPFFRRQGVRTAREIDYERYALKTIRGDFEGLSRSSPDEPVDSGRLMAAMIR
jgi:hypothetical protein